MLTRELASSLEKLGTMVVMVASPEGDFLTKASRISVMISDKPVWDAVIDVRPFSMPLTASQTARALNMLDPGGHVQVCFMPSNPDGTIASHLYYDVYGITVDKRTHTVTIHPGDFRSEI